VGFGLRGIFIQFVAFEGWQYRKIHVSGLGPVIFLFPDANADVKQGFCSLTLGFALNGKLKDEAQIQSSMPSQRLILLFPLCRGSGNVLFYPAHASPICPELGLGFSPIKATYVGSGVLH